MLVEVSSRTIIQFLEMFMDLGGQRGADLKYSHGFVKTGHKDRDDVQFCVMGMQLKPVTVFVGGVSWELGWGRLSPGQNAGPDTFEGWVFEWEGPTY